MPLSIKANPAQNELRLCRPMNSSIWFDTMSRHCFILGNSADSDEMLHQAAFHFGLHCLGILVQGSYRQVCVKLKDFPTVFND